jgi:hypothetical protein
VSGYGDVPQCGRLEDVHLKVRKLFWFWDERELSA